MGFTPISPTEEDIWRSVVYVPGHADENCLHKDCETGILVGLDNNTKTAAVQFPNFATPTPTNYHDLVWKQSYVQDEQVIRSRAVYKQLEAMAVERDASPLLHHVVYQWAHQPDQKPEDVLMRMVRYYEEENRILNNSCCRLLANAPIPPVVLQQPADPQSLAMWEETKKRTVQE